MGSGDLAAESLVPPKGKPGARGTPRFQYFKGETPSESEKGRTRRSEGFGDKALSVKRPKTNRQLNHCSSRKKGQPLHLVSHFRSWGTRRCWHLENRPMEMEWQERGSPLSPLSDSSYSAHLLLPTCQRLIFSFHTRFSHRGY